MTIVAYYAQLDNIIHGVALRDATGTVSFRTDSTGTWQTLTDADAPRLTLCGRVDVADAQMLADGNRVVRCSQALTAVAS
jgi:hypothetical protein